ncbi:glycosyltransferase [Rhodophyticola sp. CCM32]|uniref:glycosyltransferase family 2 protein n=1 Tax=Rhodophyticola sp. CCM32 TaxID=2916397 RepID=UPI00107F1E12|nr:glycosyltransferase [Rhodophyticola sp. CCM32]QBY02041.1 glycosyltransferase [Rhodophyticola sp. CCM32]
MIATAPSVSVIIVSQGRPALLRRCLLGVYQLTYRPVEMVVVADQAGLDAIADLPFADRIRTGLQTCSNISASRNMGLALASGDVLAFMDDDAVPEPNWLTRLMAGFDDPQVMAAGGHVIGRNGLSLQWGSRAVNAETDEIALDLEGTGPVRPALSSGYALKLQGTNMALRRRALDRIGGFDTSFAFYLDDTDMALRLHQAGLISVSVPSALVHHGFAPSARRAANRAPRSLTEIGASMAVYLRKHLAPDQVAPHLARFQADQLARLDRFQRQGDLTPRDVQRLRQELEDGFAIGRTRVPGQTDIPAAEGGVFQTMRDDLPLPPLYLAGRWFQADRCLADAAEPAQSGRTVTVFLFAPTPRAHRVQFTETGVWVQSGGLFGRADRTRSRVQIWSFRRRVRAETDRIEAVRS